MYAIRSYYVRCLRRETAGERVDTIEAAGIEIEGHDAARRGTCEIDAAGECEGGAAEIGDREPIDRHSLAVELDLGDGILGGDTGDRRLADLKRKRALTRPVECGIGQHRSRHDREPVEIEHRRPQCRVQARRPVACRPGIGQPAIDRDVVEFTLEALNRNAVSAERYVV